MKKGLILSLFVIVANLIIASNNTAIDYYRSGDIKHAKELLKSSQNLDAMDYYYLGMINIKENNVEAATECFNKGLQIDAENGYNKVGLATILMSTDKKAASKALKKVWKDRKYKKDVEMYCAVAEAYLLNRDADEAEYFLSKGKKANKKSASPYIIEGVYLTDEGKSNEAARLYENALYFDPNSKIALVKLAQLYIGTRMSVAFEYLQKATEIDPNYEYGWRTLAYLRYKNGFYPEAKVAQEKYMSFINPSPEDFQDYGEILYFNKDYKGAFDALGKAPINTVTNRLKMYGYYQEKDYDNALAFSDKLMQGAKPEELILQDYVYTANVKSELNDYEGAAQAYENAYKLDTTNIDMLKDASNLYKKAKNYERSAELYQMKMTKSGAISMADYYVLGGTYYNAGVDKINTPDSLKRIEYLKKADAEYAKMTENFPDNYLGYMSRATANSALDPNTTEGLAKPYYEKALELMLPQQEEHKSEILVVYQYLGIYFLKTDNYPESKKYWEKVLEISPENNLAKRVIESIDSVLKKKK